MICDKDLDGTPMTKETMISVLYSIVEVFQVLTKQQLNLLTQIGFCLSVSPVTYIIESPDSLPHFGVCYGNTGPENNLVTHHVPTASEIDSKLAVLQDIFRILPHPKHITVARSFRDGYTPKEHFSRIEDGILTAVRTVYPSFSIVHYDSNLLGGPMGWGKRNNSGILHF